MLSDHEIERAASQLADYRSNDALSEILDKYSALIQDCRRLKSDYEEERDAREKYKQLARGQERNPFVLVLVDGDGYIFHDSLLGKGSDGGKNAAQLLNEAVKASLQSKGLEHCQVMARIYANVAGLSKALSKAGLAGSNRRSLAPFIASFNRSYGLAEFIDAGELKESADFKLRALLHLYAENTQCKHIYFAACHDAGYISDLTPYLGNHARFTLINTTGIRFYNEFNKLGMGIEELPGVFRSTPLLKDAAAPHRPTHSAFGTAKAVTGLTASSSANQAPVITAMDGQRTDCRMYPYGKFKYGKAYKNLHLEDPANTFSTWRSSSHDPQSDATGSLQEPGSRPTPLLNIRQAADAFLDNLELPQDNILEGYVAVNRSNFRLDPYIPPSSPETIGRFKSRINKRRICNRFHLSGFCEAGDRCEYDHSVIDAEFKRVLQSLARSMPCPKREPPAGYPLAHTLKI
ncbi:zinc finger c-x8-C-x5-C-x3-H type (and similar) domain-containing protein [Hirsutella rhossiliensis]|uniref:Zinc finger c-x8-C-x5-C-x3-H type (And similar) domain-containing protein n=1 Tax=Hirsutella rhossiliensis TaxID=111463 RepID=A0A9P8ML70_9HYPO|nr:zinc finger c-x8-C-x5-C-x3-H type (and similar) domain-containing protein [Hirsutella rhossiliensis]KAH0957233.1 zinc finger c-x8-C-x5-C-x3-H type (and similar) domain-containing protein [Hirsutella rhossiliensis]